MLEPGSKVARNDSSRLEGRKSGRDHEGAACQAQRLSQGNGEPQQAEEQLSEVRCLCPI